MDCPYPLDQDAAALETGLAGVIINNGIVLIDKIDSDRAESIAPHAAIVNAALSRFRPILMTTVTTVFWLLPLIISFDPLFFSMALILAFGMIFTGMVIAIALHAANDAFGQVYETSEFKERE